MIPCFSVQILPCSLCFHIQMSYTNVEFHSKLESLDYGSVALCQRHLPTLHSISHLDLGLSPYEQQFFFYVFIVLILIVYYTNQGGFESATAEPALRDMVCLFSNLACRGKGKSLLDVKTYDVTVSNRVNLVNPVGYQYT